MKNNKYVPIVFTTDLNYVFPMGVTICSILSNSSEYSLYKFFIITRNNCKELCVTLIDKLKMQYDNFLFEFISIDESIFEDNKISNSHVTNATYYRLFASDLLPDYDKCICLDSDILIKKDISHLIDFDLGGAYIAGVKSWEKIEDTHSNRCHREYLGLPTLDSYIYLGVIVMNLKKIRKDNLTKDFMEHMKKNYIMEDMDVFNVCCFGHISFLPLKYNLMARYLENPLPLLNSLWSLDEVACSTKAPAIVHYPGALIKPWINLRVKLSSEWWNYAKIFESIPVYNKTLEDAVKWSKNQDWCMFVSNIPDTGEIIVYGYSEIGRCLFYRINRIWNDKIKCICDNDPDKQGSEFAVPVYSIVEARKLYPNACWIIAAQRYREEIFGQLQQNGVKSSDIIIYDHKNAFYYMAIAPQYKEEELYQLLLAECGENSRFLDCNLKDIEENLVPIWEKYRLKEWIK